MSENELIIEQEHRKALRRSRIQKYFISAAKELLDAEGLSAITIRRVSSIAGYNSATLYNYFDDLNHLSFLACMEELENYNQILSERLRGINDPLEHCLTTADCFAEFSYKSPEIFWQLFYGCPEDRREAYVREYYELFPPNNSDQCTPFAQAKLTHNLEERHLILLSGCISAGYISRENAMEFIGASSMITRCLLEDRTKNKISMEEAVKRDYVYYRHMMRSYFNPEFQNLLEGF